MTRALALIPFRSLADPKRRLASVLSQAERVALARAMLQDVIDALHASMAAPHIAIVSRESDIAPAGCLCLGDSGGGLNAALSGAFAMLRDAFGAQTPILVVPADLPLLRPAIVDRAFAALDAPGTIVLAPALVDGGTNLLGQRGGCVVPPLFGADSFRAHRAAAREAGLAVTTIDDPGVGRDIDRPDDLVSLAASPHASRSRTVARDWQVAARASASVALV